VTTYFVTRHKGAVKWARGQGVDAENLDHLDPEIVTPGDKILGILPVSIAAEVCGRGGRYFHLSFDRLPRKDRGRELNCEEMKKFGAKLEEFEVRKLG